MEDYLGLIEMFAGNFAPVGYMLCDGSLLPINQYQAVFSILGTTYGGDGRTTFALPDLREVHPSDKSKYWNPDKPRWIMCVQGIFPSRN